MYVPARASVVLPAKTPVRGSEDAIDAAVTFLRDVMTDCSNYAVGVNVAASELGNCEGESATELQGKLSSSLFSGAHRLRRTADEAKSGFAAYGTEVERIHRGARRLLDRVDEHLETIRVESGTVEDIAAAIRWQGQLIWGSPPPAQLPTPALDAARESALESALESAETSGMDAAEVEVAQGNLASRYEDEWRSAVTAWALARDGIDSERARWSTLVAEREAAERALVGALGATELGRLIAMTGDGADERRLTVAAAYSGEAWGQAAINMSHPLLRRLIGTQVGADIWDSPPDPEKVAAGWDSLSDSQKQRLIDEVPWVIGNLVGLPFRVRDEANRKMLAFYEQNRWLLDKRGRAALDALVEVRDAKGTPKWNLVALNLTGPVPMVAMGYGNLDTTDYLTWQGPGMENDADKAISGWDEASRNLYLEQVDLFDVQGIKSLPGVIAFLGYDTPDLIDSLSKEKGVLSPKLAKEGAVRLAAELDGSWVTLNHGLGHTQGFRAPGAPHIGVVAHSYGTTLAANALTQVKYPVDSFSMAGLAGLDTSTVGFLDDLRVAKAPGGQAQIFASHASDDRLAPLGLGVSGRGNPNPNLVYSRAPNLEGAMHYSSDGYVDPSGQTFKRTTGHSVIGEHGGVLHDIGFVASEGHGYWDPGTQSLRNIAASTTGMDHMIVGGVYARK